MRKLYIDRFEGKFAICENDDQKAFAIPKDEMPNDANEGDVIIISDNAEIIIDREETKARKQKLLNMQKKLWK